MVEKNADLSEAALSFISTKKINTSVLGLDYNKDQRKFEFIYSEPSNIDS